MIADTIELLVIDTGENKPKTGDAANLTAYLSIDGGAFNALADTSASEVDNVHARGIYRFSLSNAERTGSRFLFTGVSTTVGVEVIPRELRIDISPETGARTVVVTVNDGVSPLQNAVVRLTEGVNSYRGETNASGVATFNVDDATYTVGVTKSGYSFAGATLVVDGNESVTYSMTQVVVTPSLPGTKTGYFVTYDQSGAVQSSVIVNMALKSFPAGHIGHVRDDDVVTVTSNGSGIAQFTGLIPGAKYYAWRGSRSRPEKDCGVVTIPLSATDGFQIGSISGLD